jgi:hypothetical protein
MNMRGKSTVHLKGEVKDAGGGGPEPLTSWWIDLSADHDLKSKTGILDVHDL